MAGIRQLSILSISVCCHALILGSFFLFAKDAPPQEEVYRVALAEFASPAPVPASLPPEAAPAQPEVPPAPPEVVPPPSPQPAPKKTPPKPATKTISTQKQPTPPAKEVSPPPLEQVTHAAPPASSPHSGESLSGGEPSQTVGGLSAYDHDMVEQRPSITRRVQPEYPSNARRRNIQGVVLVQLVVDTQGYPQACTVRSAEPAGYFENAALTAARSMRFSPGKLRGQAVNTVTVIPFAFKLR